MIKRGVTRKKIRKDPARYGFNLRPSDQGFEKSLSWYAQSKEESGKRFLDLANKSNKVHYMNTVNDYEEAAFYRLQNSEIPKAIQDYRKASESCKLFIKYIKELQGKESGEDKWQELIRKYEKSTKTNERIANRLEEVTRGGWKGLGAKNVSAIIPIGSLIGGLFFLSFNITGNVITDLSFKTISWLGFGLFIFGLVTGFIWIKTRSKKTI